MYNIEFYESKDGSSELWDFRIMVHILVKKSQSIWKMVSGNSDRGTTVYYTFFCEANTYVLLHQFRKKTQKTPRREIEKAKAERADYLSRKES